MTAKKIVKKDEVKTMDQLVSELATKKTDLLQAKKGNAAGELTNPRVITTIRKDIARLHTAVRATELGEKKEDK